MINPFRALTIGFREVAEQSIGVKQSWFIVIACTLVLPGLTVWQMLNPPLTLINVGFSILGTWLCGSLMGLSLSGYYDWKYSDKAKVIGDKPE